MLCWATDLKRSEWTDLMLLRRPDAQSSVWGTRQSVRPITLLTTDEAYQSLMDDQAAQNGARKSFHKAIAQADLTYVKAQDAAGLALTTTTETEWATYQSQRVDADVTRDNTLQLAQADYNILVNSASLTLELALRGASKTYDDSAAADGKDSSKKAKSDRKAWEKALADGALDLSQKSITTGAEKEADQARAMEKFSNSIANAFTTTFGTAGGGTTGGTGSTAGSGFGALATLATASGTWLSTMLGLVSGRAEREQDAADSRDERKADAEDSLIGSIVSGVVGWLNENATARTVFTNVSITISTAYDIVVRNAGKDFAKSQINAARDAAIGSAEQLKQNNENWAQAAVDALEARSVDDFWAEPSDTYVTMLEYTLQNLDDQLATDKQGYIERNGLVALKAWVVEVDASGVLDDDDTDGETDDDSNNDTGDEGENDPTPIDVQGILAALNAEKDRLDGVTGGTGGTSPESLSGATTGSNPSGAPQGGNGNGAQPLTITGPNGQSVTLNGPGSQYVEIRAFDSQLVGFLDVNTGLVHGIDPNGTPRPDQTISFKSLLPRLNKWHNWKEVWINEGAPPNITGGTAATELGDEAAQWSLAQKFLESLRYAYDNNLIEDALKNDVQQLLETAQDPVALMKMITLMGGMAAAKKAACKTGLGGMAGAVLTAADVAQLAASGYEIYKELGAISFKSETANAAPFVARVVVDNVKQMGITQLLRLIRCFAAGTRVVVHPETAGAVRSAVSGAFTKAIEELVEGDRVLARDEFSDETGWKRIEATKQGYSTHLQHVTIEDGSGGRQTLKCTDNHPFWVHEWGGFVRAGLLEPGHTVLGPNGEFLHVVSNRHEEHPLGTPVYNVTVEGFHTYFVQEAVGSRTAVWTHNAKCLNDGNEGGTTPSKSQKASELEKSAPENTERPTRNYFGNGQTVTPPVTPQTGDGGQGSTSPTPNTGRFKGQRMTSDDDALQQLEEIEKAQLKVRQGKSKQIIDSIEKSKQRVKNAFRNIRSIDDLEEYE